MTLPPVADRVPRRHHPLLQAVGRRILRATGWRVTGQLPNQSKFVIIVAPHTSNWDFIHGAAAMLALDLQLYWLGKHTLFRGPLGPLLRYLGGVPVDREAPGGVVEQAVAAFDARDEFVLTITPEGTRGRVKRWKSGFHRIAHGAEVPVVPVFLDYRQSTIGIGPAFETSDDLDADVKALRIYFENVRGKNVRGY